MYQEFQNTSKRLIDQYGHSATIVTYDESNNESTVALFSYVAAPIEIDELTDTRIQSSDMKIYVSSAYRTPKVQEYVKIDSTLYKVLMVEDVKPANLSIMVGVYLKK